MHSIAHLRTHSNANTQSQRYMESYICAIPTQTHSSHLYTFRYTLSDVYKHSLTHIQRHEFTHTQCMYIHTCPPHMFSHSKHTQTLTHSHKRTQQNHMKSHHRLHLHNLTHSHHARIVTGTQSLLTCSDTLVPAHRITLSYTCVYMNPHNTRSCLPAYTDTHPHKIIHTITHNGSHTHRPHCRTPSHTCAPTHLHITRSYTHVHLCISNGRWDYRCRWLCLAFDIGDGDLKSGPRLLQQTQWQMNHHPLYR